MGIDFLLTAAAVGKHYNDAPVGNSGA